MIIAYLIDGLQRRQVHLRYIHTALGHGVRVQVDIEVLAFLVEPSCSGVEGSAAMGHARGIALQVRLDDARLTIGDGKEPSVVLPSPWGRVTVLDGAVLIQQRDIHDQILGICQRDVVLKDMQPQRIVGGKHARVEV